MRKKIGIRIKRGSAPSSGVSIDRSIGSLLRPESFALFISLLSISFVFDGDLRVYFFSSPIGVLIGFPLSFHSDVLFPAL